MPSSNVNYSLWRAASIDDTEACQELLENDQSADLRFQHHGMSALHVAAANGFVKTCEILLDYSIDVNIDS